MTSVVAIHGQRMFLSEDCDNTGGEQALGIRQAVIPITRSQRFWKVCCEFRGSEECEAWLALSILASQERNSLSKAEDMKGM